MEAVGAASAIVGLAIPVFQCAKALRDRIKMVASEKADLLAAFVEYEKDINLLESLYNDNKALLDQHNLDTDLRELAVIIQDLDQWLNSINLDFGKKRLPSIKELWRSGDLRDTMVASNARISSIRNRWQTRLQVCTLASTTVILGRQDAGQAETTALLHQVISMLQQEHGPVRQRARALSMHAQVEPIGFNSQTTRIVANTTASVVTFTILSPDASLSYDRIKLRLDEYRTLLASDSDTIELVTENGKTVICRKQANEMEQFLDRAEKLLQDVIQSCDVSTLVVLQRLRDLTEVLDTLKLHDECRLTGNCALGLAEALGGRSIEFRHEQAETLALIAGLSVYKPRARTLFIQAVAICEEVVASDASYSNQVELLIVLHRAGYWACDHPDLCVQWLGTAVRLITNELPSVMVPASFRTFIYNHYGNGLFCRKDYVGSIEAYQEAISILRGLVKDDPVKYTHHLAQSLDNVGHSFRNLGKYDDAIATFKGAIDLCRATSAQDPLRYNVLATKILHNYAKTLFIVNQVDEAAELMKEAVSLSRHLTEMGERGLKRLCISLHSYATYCCRIGRYAEAISAYQESIPLWRGWIATDPGEKAYLLADLHNMAISLHALGKIAEADAAAIEALQMDDGKLLRICLYAPNLSSCFVCQRTITPDPSILHSNPSTLHSQPSTPSTPLSAFFSHFSLSEPSTPLSATAPRIKKRDKILTLFKSRG